MPKLSRRGALQGAFGAAVAAASASSAASASAASPDPKSATPLPNLSAILKEPLLNRARASAVMKAAGLQALVLSSPLNVYYATNRMPAVDRGESEGSAMAVIPADPAAPVVLISGLFEYYYIVTDYQLPPSVEAIIVDPMLGNAAPDVHNGMFRDLRQVPLDDIELSRRARTTAASKRVGNQAAGLRLALAGVKSGVVGVDNYQSAAVLQEARPLLSTRPAEDIARRVRLVKSPAEIALMTAAAQANVAAGLEAGRTARESGSIRHVRERFYAEAAERGNTGVFMVVDGTLAEPVDRPLVDGQALLIDCVSQCGGYHGDYARTVFIGEPRKPMLKATSALGVGWDSVRAMLRPGVKFSEIHAHGVETMKKLGYDYTISFGPHSVGLFHTDQPRRGLDGLAEDIVLEKDMIISVDCPLMDTGLGGTAHLEDLTLITADGGVPIHPVGDRIIVV